MPSYAKRLAVLAAWILVTTALFGSLLESNPEDATVRNPYTAEALEKNPNLGWQPPPSHLDISFSWRTCFNKAVTDSDRPAGCRENITELGSAPTAEKDWVPDVTMIREMFMYGKDRYGNVFPPPLDNELCENINGQTGGMEGDTNKECILQSNIRSLGALNATTVKIAATTNHSESVDGQFLEVPAPKIMCMVYTMANSHANRIRAIRETWAGGCDGFLAFSTESDPRLPAISIEHEGPEAYDNMWQKVRSIWKFVGTHYLSDFDWFLIGGDDLFVLPYNLKAYLASLAEKDGADPKTKEYYVGRRLKRKNDKDYFNGGGPGYLLSQATLRKFYVNLNDTQHCFANERTSMEDVMAARCLRHLGIQFTDTRDSRGRERFHHYPPGKLFHGGHLEWYTAFNREWGIKQGKDCCAPDSVSFHYIKEPSMMRHLQILLQHCGGSKTLQI
ncbi:hypothetical protein ACHAXR_009023 [Thalassiosira sp. AJA248-18]